MNNKKIIGLSGTNGSGKDTVGHILAEKYGYLFVSVTDLLRAEATKRGQPVEREVLRTISAEWRRESGLGVLCERAIAEYDKVKDQYQGVVMASLRNPGEADAVHEHGGVVIWVDADPRTRYNRIQANALTRGRAEEDNKTFEQFLVEEQAEMHSSGDEATLDMAGVKAKADVLLENDGDNLVVLQENIEQALGLNP
ncbi:MAG TPA: AAA family ATPase [Candidatus Saccharimonadales bacterium]|nr:AAA family ATPase [Candidatus Saccharimonadales bacterium]